MGRRAGRRSDDYRKVVGLCDEGKRLTTWVPLDDRSCFETNPKPFTDILDNCGLFSIDISLSRSLARSLSHARTTHTARTPLIS